MIELVFDRARMRLSFYRRTGMQLAIIRGSRYSDNTTIILPDVSQYALSASEILPFNLSCCNFSRDTSFYQIV